MSQMIEVVAGAAQFFLHETVAADWQKTFKRHGLMFKEAVFQGTYRYCKSSSYTVLNKWLVQKPNNKVQCCGARAARSRIIWSDPEPLCDAAPTPKMVLNMVRH
jgi:hypothetical protein